MRASLAGRYTIERELGRGGMATVYLARDLKHDRPVALKVLRPELAAILGAERFLREIRIAARLQHPNILPLYDSGDAEGMLFYVMPYVEGESLRDRLERHGPLPLEDALRIAGDVAEALSYAHAHDVVHRDVKPENILLEGQRAVVADFGIARAVTAAGGDRLTDTGIAVGTPVYMSPEQASAEPRIDGRSDIYSLGCVVYEMLAGHPPFTGSTAQEVSARHSMDAVPRLRAARRALPDAVEAAVDKALAKAAADRFATAAQFTEAICGRAERAPLAQLLRTAGLFGVASVVVLGVVYVLMIALGLPDWVLAGAIVLLLLGLPV
ncbi:MAG TPA: serine/threonine-protein kinase, partial [Gemmatimonadales bacterium]